MAIIIIILFVAIGNMAGFYKKFFQKDNLARTSISDRNSSHLETKEVVVPDFRGKTLQEAQTLARKLSIEVKQTATQASNIYAQGEIIFQETEAKTKVAKNSTINVTVSSGKANVTIPNGLTGASQTDAESILQRLGLITSTDLKYSDTVKIGRIISVDPDEGKSVLSGSTVKLYVSKGANPTQNLVEIPSLRGYSEEDAKSILDRKGLKYITTTEYTNELEIGNVISLSPGPGEQVPAGSTIMLTINTKRASEGDTRWVCYSRLKAPEAYNGGHVRLELVQNDTVTTIYEGANPWRNGTYKEAIYGAPGVSTGVINVYENDELIENYSHVTFKAP